MMAEAEATSAEEEEEGGTAAGAKQEQQTREKGILHDDWNRQTN